MTFVSFFSASFAVSVWHPFPGDVLLSFGGAVVASILIPKLLVRRLPKPDTVLGMGPEDLRVISRHKSKEERRSWDRFRAAKLEHVHGDLYRLVLIHNNIIGSHEPAILLTFRSSAVEASAVLAVVKSKLPDEAT